LVIVHQEYCFTVTKDDVCVLYGHQLQKLLCICLRGICRAHMSGNLTDM
jgi:hypothetical protein